MSTEEMNSQGSACSEDLEMEQDYSDDEEDTYGYYDNNGEDQEMEHNKKEDPEYFESELLKVEDVERMLNEKVEALCTSIHIQPSLAKMMLYASNWDVSKMINQYKANPAKMLADCRLTPEPNAIAKQDTSLRHQTCPVCMQRQPNESLHSVACGHLFCRDCWQMHFHIQIQNGITTGMFI